jgi:hypothetical protein
LAWGVIQEGVSFWEMSRDIIGVESNSMSQRIRSGSIISMAIGSVNARLFDSGSSPSSKVSVVLSGFTFSCVLQSVGGADNRSVV